MAGLTALLRGSRKATKVKAPKKVLTATDKMKARTVGPNDEGNRMKNAVGTGRTAIKKLDVLSAPKTRAGRDMAAKKSVRIKPRTVKPMKPTVKRLPR